MTTDTQKIPRTRPSWLSRFWAVVRYEMLWNIRKKKFIGIVILGFVITSVALFLPPILSSVTGQALTSNPDYVVTYSIPAFGLFLFALATVMNSISSEFESGTIVPLLTKPISRTMVFLGKLFAAFIIILVTYTVLFVYVVIGGTVVYGAQNSLQLVPLGLLGNVITTFIWIAIILSCGITVEEHVDLRACSLLLVLGFAHSRSHCFGFCGSFNCPEFCSWKRRRRSHEHRAGDCYNWRWSG